MEIHDGPDETAPLIGRRLCGPQKPAPITSTGNMLFVRFDTDFSIVSTGYKIRADLGKLNFLCARDYQGKYKKKQFDHCYTIPSYLNFSYFRNDNFSATD